LSSVDCEVLVIGGGVIGLLVANQLSNKGLETILVEKNPVLGEEVYARKSGIHLFDPDR
jgi:heterodisulfide reductase subunit A-like polyferredoxin